MSETPRRFVRVPDSIWNPANARAQRENTDLSKVIRAKLTEYVNDVPAIAADTL